MTKEEILAKSRLENKNKDMVAYETEKQAGKVAAIIGAIVCGTLFVIQLCAGGGINFALWAVVVSIQAANYSVKAFKMQQKIHTLLAVLFLILTLCLCAGHIFVVTSNQPYLFSTEDMSSISEIAD